MFEKKEHQNSGTLCKDTIIHWIISFLSVENLININKIMGGTKMGKHGKAPKAL